MKGGKKTTGKTNFYLTVLNELESSTNLTKIQEKLGISKQRLNYYLRGLKQRGLIIHKTDGWYEVVKDSKNSTKYGDLLKKDSSRGHAYVWRVELPKEIEGWDKRLELLDQKKIHFNRVGALKTTPRIKALGRKVWLCNDHLRIFDTKKASYYGETAKESRPKANLELLRIVRCLENKLGFLFKPLRYSIQKEHYALIKNDLAIDQNEKGIIMRISDEEGEWLLIDDSLEEGGELETVGKKAYKTNIEMQKWWNKKKENNFKIDDDYIETNIEKANERIKKISEQNIMLSQVMEQMSNNQIRLTKEVYNLKNGQK